MNIRLWVLAATIIVASGIGAYYIANKGGKHTLGVKNQSKPFQEQWLEQLAAGGTPEQLIKQGEFAGAAYLIERRFIEGNAPYSQTVKVWLKALETTTDTALKRYIAERILAITAAYQPDSLYLMYWARAHAHKALGNRMEGVFELITLLRHDSTYVPAHIQLARLFLNINNSERATEHLIKALAIDPDNQQALKLLDSLRNTFSHQDSLLNHKSIES